MSTLALKRRRDMGRQKWQFIAVGVTVVLGVAMFAGTFNAYLNLGSSLAGSYDRLAMADMTVVGAADGFVDEVVEIEGVANAIERRQADAPMEIDDVTLVGRVVGMPVDGQPAINMLDISDGEYLDPSDEAGVVLETHAAQDFGIGVGDTFSIAGTEVTVRGIATSTEYLWPARDSQNVFTAPNSFAVVFADESWLPDGGPAVTEQVLVLYDDGVDTEALDDEVAAAATAAGANVAEPLELQASNFIINEEISGLQTMAIAFPLLFLAAAGMAIYVVITRLVYSQRGVIGTLRASGFDGGRMSRHYLGFGVSVGLIGAVIGMILGSLLGRGMTAIYTNVFGIPDLVARVHVPTIVAALAFGLVAGALAAVPPARIVARMPPAEAMRGDVPTDGSHRSVFEQLIPPLRRAPVRVRMSLRGIQRNTKRSVSMILGVVLGMTLIIASWGMLDTMLLAFDRQFDEVAIDDASVVFDESVGDAQVERVESVGDAQVERVESVGGVAVAEPVVALPAVVVSGDERFQTSLEGYRAGTQVHGFSPPLPPDGVLLGQATEGLLDIGEGDEVVIEFAPLDATITATVAGFVDEPLGTLAYMDVEALTASLAAADPAVTAEVLAQPSITLVKAVFEDGADGDAVLDRLRDVEGVAVVVDSNEVEDLIQDFQLFFYVFIGMMIVFGGAMAFALIFNIISVNTAERTGEYASMRANGLTHRRVPSLIVGETGLLTAIGIVPGLIVGYLAAAAFVGSFSSVEFPITLELRPLSYIGVIVVMFVVAGLSLIPAVRSVRRIDVGEVVRERST